MTEEQQPQKEGFFTPGQRKFMWAMIELLVMGIIILMIYGSFRHDLKARGEALDQCNQYIKDNLVVIKPASNPFAEFTADANNSNVDGENNPSTPIFLSLE